MVQAIERQAEAAEKQRGFHADALATDAEMEKRGTGHRLEDVVRVVYHSATQEEEAELKGNSFAIEGADPVRTFVGVVHSEACGDVALGCAMAESSDEVSITVGAPGGLELEGNCEEREPSVTARL